MQASQRLNGWSRERRVVLVREAPALAPVGEQRRRRRDHLARALPGVERWSRKIAPWSGRVAMLVTTLDPMAFPAEIIARLYRERADAENIYDELKNQWGMEWLYHSKTRALPTDGCQHGGAGLQLVASLCEALRCRAPSRSDH